MFTSRSSIEGSTTLIVEESPRLLKRFLVPSPLSEVARLMVLRMALGFIMRRGRMSCSAAAGAVASQAIHRGQLTRFLIRPRWQQVDFNHPLRMALLGLEAQAGQYVFIVDATLVSQAGRKTHNTYTTGNRQRRPRNGRRYNQ